MKAMQIHLDERQRRALDRAARETGASRAELIRRAIDLVYEGSSARTRPLPHSIGVVSESRIPAAQAKEWIRENWLKDLERRRATPES
jgi:metal-responsive CopG/Arc/MetJ family transcriptional regulator